MQPYEIVGLVEKVGRWVVDAVDRHTASQQAIAAGLKDVADAIREHTTALEALAQDELGLGGDVGPADGDYDGTD